MIGWIKSSHSSGDGGACVEVRFGDVVGVRDSKNPDGPRLGVSTGAWLAFLSTVTRRTR
ncbi:DUF397 domain-containing protein [Lentzea sp. NPDC006480]|uniref:DUF397 domain-containing protein n=1 Tax=Lentzea sp. NPDC006480 TaxID=3157176 RepID=UPI0033A15787